MLELEGQIKMEEMCFSRFLKMGKDSAALIELGRSFHQMGSVNEKVCESVSKKDVLTSHSVYLTI